MEKGFTTLSNCSAKKSELAEVMAQDPRCLGYGKKTDPFLHPQVFMPANDDHLLIVPKKLPNPVLGSRNHVNMQRELKLNSKLGIDVLHQKSELDKVFREKKREDFRKETEVAKPKKSDFELMIEKRRKDQEANEQKEEDEKLKPEFLQIRNRLVKSDSS